MNHTHATTKHQLFHNTSCYIMGSHLTCCLGIIFLFFLPPIANSWRDFYSSGVLQEIQNDCSFNGEPCPCAPPREDKNETYLTLIDILTKGSEYLQNYTFVDEAVIALGVTGVGKTTAVQIIAGNLTELYAVGTPGGDLVIIDENNLIGAGASSKTFFPQLFVHRWNESDLLHFYDFPGFRDTRGAEADIAANFFMNEVVKRVGKVKLLFVTTWEDLKSRHGLNDLTTSALNFINDINNLRDSVGLVVNKAEFWKTEDQIIGGTVDYLNKFMDWLRGQLTGNPSEDAFTMKQMYLTEIFLQQVGDNRYTKFWFIQTPNQCGSLNNSERVHTTRRNLLGLCESLRYSSVTNDTFGFALDLKTKTEIEKTHTPEVNEAIAIATLNATQDLQSWYLQNKIRSSSQGLRDLANMLLSDKLRLEELLNDVSTDPDNFLDLLESFWHELGHGIPPKIVDYIKMQQSFLVFFDEAVGSRQVRNATLWKKGILCFQTKIDDLQTWYEFCTTLQEKLQHVDFHKNRPEAPLESESWFEYIKRENIVPVSHKVETVVERMELFELGILEELLKFAIQVPTFVKYDKNILLIYGNFIRLGEVFSEIINNSMESYREAHIFAAHTIFLDENVTYSGNEIVMIAPLWVSHSNNQWKIQVNGPDGKSYDEDKARNGTGGSEHTNPSNGENGCAGKPGGPGGFLFGVATSILSSKPIFVSSNGGRGGPGQKGGDGGAGYGRDAIFCINDDNYDSPETCTHRTDIDYVECVHNGRNGQNGASGGHGGAGGKGGYPGSADIVVFSKEDSSEIENSQTNGTKGIDGNGGAGGLGGKVGAGYKCSSTCLSVAAAGRHPGQQGRKGDNGASVLCTKEPDLPEKHINETLALLEYKSRFAHTSHRVTLQFIDSINNMK